MLGYVVIGIIFLAGISLCVRLNRNNLKQVDHVELDLGQVTDMEQINEMCDMFWEDVRCDQDEDNDLKENEIDCNKPMRVEQKIAFIRHTCYIIMNVGMNMRQMVVISQYADALIANAKFLIIWSQCLNGLIKCPVSVSR